MDRFYFFLLSNESRKWGCRWVGLIRKSNPAKVMIHIEGPRRGWKQQWLKICTRTTCIWEFLPQSLKQGVLPFLLVAGNGRYTICRCYIDRAGLRDTSTTEGRAETLLRRVLKKFYILIKTPFPTNELSERWVPSFIIPSTTTPILTEFFSGKQHRPKRRDLQILTFGPQAKCCFLFNYPKVRSTTQLVPPKHAMPNQLFIVSWKKTKTKNRQPSSIIHKKESL